MVNSFVIGDVHGCYHTLMKLIEKLPSDANLIFLGDLCDKGNFSKEVIEFVINGNYLCLKGNHEYLLYNYIRDAIFKDKHNMWSKNKLYGGYKSVQSYQDSHEILQKHIKWIETLPNYIEFERYFLTHAFGLPYYKRRDEKSSQRKLFTTLVHESGKKREDWEDFSSYDVINIFGHCDFKEVLEGSNYYGIDTGCVYGNKLTAINLESFELYQHDVEDVDIAVGF
jgi:serine/threonine protein phosphatase 1